MLTVPAISTVPAEHCRIIPTQLRRFVSRQRCRQHQRIGTTRAEQIGTGHENADPTTIPFGNEMDRHDNAVGRSLGGPGADCSAECMDAVTTGQLRTIRGPDTNPQAVPPIPSACIGASDQPWP
jgi:hypothetical protein